MQHWSEVIDNYTLMPYNYDTVFLDEVQFMDTTDTLLHVNTILNRDVNVVAAGLDQDSKGYPFETTAMLLALSDEVIKIQAICTTCGKPATKTQRRQDATDNRVAVGSIGIYEPKCVEHWIAR
jgi:thymidine kinase